MAAPTRYLAELPLIGLAFAGARRLGGWQSFESDGVGPFFTGGDATCIDYATQLMRGRAGKIRVTDSAGNVEEVIPFTKQIPGAGVGTAPPLADPLLELSDGWRESA